MATTYLAVQMSKDYADWLPAYLYAHCEVVEVVPSDRFYLAVVAVTCSNAGAAEMTARNLQNRLLSGLIGARIHPDKENAIENLIALS